MNCQSFMLLVAAGLGLPAAATATDARLDALRWKARPVVVLSDKPDDPSVSRQLAALDGARDGVSERDIQVLRESGPRGALRRRLGVTAPGFAVVLVGKDGGVKAVWREPVNPKQIFTIIDRMPMRRDEMKG